MMLHTNDKTERPTADDKYACARSLIAALGKSPSVRDCAIVMAYAVDADDADTTQHLVDTFDERLIEQVMECFLSEPTMIEAICNAVERRSTRMHLSFVLERAAVLGCRESVAVLVRHAASDALVVCTAADALAIKCNAAGARLLFEVCAQEPCVSAEQYANDLKSALTVAARHSAYSVIDALAPLCTPDLLHDVLVACHGDGIAYCAFEGVWMHACKRVCVHKVAADLRSGMARALVRRVIHRLGKGVACESADCIYAHRSIDVAHPRPQRSRRSEQRMVPRPSCKA